MALLRRNHEQPRAKFGSGHRFTGAPFKTEVEMKAWVKARDSERRCYEAIARVFGGHPHLLKSFFEEQSAMLMQSPEQMLKKSEGFVDSEIVLIKVALDIWSGSGDAIVWQVLEVLDGDNFRNVIHGLMMVKREYQTYIGPLSLP